MITENWIQSVEERRQALKSQHSNEDIWDFEQSIIVKLIEVENALELIEKFLSEYESEFAAIYKDGSRYAAETSGDKNNGYFNGETIGQAIAAFYEAQKGDAK